MSLLRRLFLLVLLAIMPILAVEITNQIYLHDDRVAAIHDEAERLATMFDDEHARLVEGIRQLLSTWAESSALRERDMAGCQEMAERLRESYPAYLGITATDEAGVIRCATMPIALGVAIGDRPHVRRARETGGFAIGEFIVRRDTHKPALSFALPYRDRAGVPAGFVSALLDLGWLEDYLARKPLPAGAAITLADRHGVVLARVPEVPGAVGKRLPERYLPLLERAERGSIEMVGLDGAMRVQGYVPLAVGTSGLFIMAGLDRAAALAPIHEGHVALPGGSRRHGAAGLGCRVVGRAPLHPRSRAGSGRRDRALARRRLRGPGEPQGRRLGAGRARARLRRHGREPGGSRPGARGGPRGGAQGCRGVRLHDRQRVRGRPRLAHHLHERARPRTRSRRGRTRSA